MSPDDEARQRRALARRDWIVRKHALGDRRSDDLRPSTTAVERLEMMWALALEAWALTGRPLPDYDRAHTPVRKLLRRVP